MSTMGESFYGRTHLRQDLSPYSPVSPFSLPMQYDSPLGTPVSLSHSYSMLSTSAFSAQKDVDVKLSPALMSPTYLWLGCDDEYDENNKVSEMKHKDPPGTRRISASNDPLPASPNCYYFGQFGVSAKPVTETNSSASMIPSPLTAYTNGHNGGDEAPRRNTSPQISQSFRSRPSPPVLLSTPLPSLLKSNSCRYRQASLQPVSPSSTANSSLPDTLMPLPSRRKRKPLGESKDGEILLSGEMTIEERLLMELTEQQNLPWKDVAIKFEEQTGKTMKVPALQMRKKRLVERLRSGPPSEERKVWDDHNRSKWETITNGMPQFGRHAKLPKELVDKKWQEMHSDDDAPCDPDFDSKWEMEQRAWSDEGGSRRSSLNGGDGDT